MFFFSLNGRNKFVVDAAVAVIAVYFPSGLQLQGDQSCWNFATLAKNERMANLGA